MRLIKILTSIVTLALVLASCDKDNTKQNNPKEMSSTQKEGQEQGEEQAKEDSHIKEIVIDASDYSRFVYFSFEKGLLAISDKQSRKSLNWDMAFHRGDFRTNSGLSSDISAQGGVFQTDKTDLNEKIELPAKDKFVQDTLNIVTMGHTEAIGVLEQRWAPVNTILTTVQRVKLDKEGNPIKNEMGLEQYTILHEGAIIRDFSIMPPPVKLSNKVYIVRTANSKFAKIKITNYQTPNGARIGLPRGAKITMQYIYPVE